eukprot:TRINITY_DN1901_c0_g1_i10.p1 TRINITY_DN1901_c0_g1~~TRINITY_DN1901_c0_g1_i10.p1  ORF type:complete len:345 (+),score=52.67 TRINITY_DN1901_c0_g1_i10:77-1111(+)
MCIRDRIIRVTYVTDNYYINYMVNYENSIGNRILDISFNQDQGCFALSTERGFSVFNSYPFKDSFQRDFNAGIGIVAMLFRSNVLTLVGGGISPQYPPNKVILWDDQQMKCIGELVFESNVKAVMMRREHMVVVLQTKALVYRVAGLKLLDAIKTFENPQGMCAVSSRDEFVVAVPDETKGQVKIINYSKNFKIVIKAHESPLTALAISQDGRMCGTASSKGTLVRVFATDSGSLAQELRRGTDKADIQSVTFDSRCHWLACTSDKGTVHVFSLDLTRKAVYKEEKKQTAENTKSVFKFMRGIIPYFDSEWSFAQFRIPDTRSIVAFGPEAKNSIIGIICISLP